MKTRQTGQGAARHTLRALTMMALVVAAVGCSGAKVTTKSSNELPHYKIQTLALVPFTSLKTPQVHDQRDLYFSTPYGVRGSDISVAIPPDTEVPSKRTETVPAYAADKVTQLFWKRLQPREGLHVLPPGDAAKVAPVTAEAAKTTPEAAAANLAQRLKADAAFIGEVLMFQERVGSRMGANPTAAVGFEVKVVAADGQVLWVGNYYERQRPMTEDFMGFIHRWAFVTADELAQYGVEEVLKEFPFGATAK
ncbi:hypothetical protein ACO9S2_11190 [Nitrospira sp. NS4]|uniref:hypothetical protein n=1 Tax=Nitrospira sp. NS4 TaxID=3414498 RepID=UPI003C2E35FC